MDDEREREGGREGGREREMGLMQTNERVGETYYRLLWNAMALMLATVLAAGCPGPLMLRMTTLAGAGRPASGQAKW